MRDSRPKISVMAGPQTPSHITTAAPTLNLRLQSQFHPQTFRWNTRAATPKTTPNSVVNVSKKFLLSHPPPPSAQVIQASGSVDLARSVVIPLLTRDAIDFLHASGTAEERHLWVALGDGWTKSRSDRK